MASKKLKKLLKKAGKAALIGGALYGATKLGRRRATDAPGNALAAAKKLMTQKMAYNARETEPSYPDAILRGQRGVKKHRFDHSGVKIPRHSAQMQWGTGLKKGGSVTGAAKRGFGRALMKGKK